MVSRALLPRTGMILAAYAILAILAGIGLFLPVRTPGSVAWAMLIAPILIAAFVYPRQVYLSMVIVLLAVRMWLDPRLTTHAEELTVSLLVPGAGAALLAEIIHRLNAERRRHEAALWKSEERFRSIFESSAMGISILDRDGRVVTSNQALHRMLGVSAGDLHRTRIFEWMHPDDAAENQAAFQALIRGQHDHYQRENRYYRADGRRVWGRLSVSLVRDSRRQPQYAVGILEDITVRKQAEEALRESEARFRAIFEGSAIGMVLLDLGGRAFESNPALQRMLGYPGEALQSGSFDARAHPDDSEPGQELFRELVAGRRDHYQIERRYLRSDGAVVWARDTRSLVRGSAGEPLFVIAMLEDVTEQRRAEQEREKLSEQRANMIATVSHELRAPVAAMMLNFDLLADGTLGELNPEQQEYVQGAIRSILDLAKTVDDLLAVSRLQDGRVKLHLDRVDLNSLLEDVFARMQPRARSLGVTMELRSEEELPLVETDAQQLAHVVTELIENAVKYSSRGGDGQVIVSARSGDATVIVEVADNGPGIPEDELEHIFEPFYRSPAAMRDQIPGTGLGLNIVKQIAHLLGIGIAVESRPGCGARFRLELPLRRVTRPGPAAPLGQPARTGTAAA